MRTRLGLDAVQEFQVMTTGYSAEFGRSGAGAVNVILKSGGNDIHGNAFYLLRDDSFDKPAFQLVNGIASHTQNVPPCRRGFADGMVTIPHDDEKAGRSMIKMQSPR
jgi:hypothetical protein